MLSEGTMKSSKGGRLPKVLPSTAHMNYNKDQHGMITLRVHYGTHALTGVDFSILGLKTDSTRGKSY